MDIEGLPEELLVLGLDAHEEESFAGEGLIEEPSVGEGGFSICDVLTTLGEGVLYMDIVKPLLSGTITVGKLGMEMATELRSQLACGDGVIMIGEGVLVVCVERAAVCRLLLCEDAVAASEELVCGDTGEGVLLVCMKREVLWRPLLHAGKELV